MQMGEVLHISYDSLREKEVHEFFFLLRRYEEKLQEGEKKKVPA